MAGAGRLWFVLPSASKANRSESAPALAACRGLVIEPRGHHGPTAFERTAAWVRKNLDHRGVRGDTVACEERCVGSTERAGPSGSGRNLLSVCLVHSHRGAAKERHIRQRIAHETQTETKIRFVTVPVGPTVIVLVEAFAGAAVTATSNAPTPTAAASFHLIAPSPVFVAFQAFGLPHS